MLKEDTQRHCEEVHEEVEDTTEKPEDGIKEHKTDGDRPFTEEGRIAEMSVDLVLQARMSF